MLVTVKPSKATVVISGYFCKSPLHAVCDEKCQKYFGSTDVINLFLFPQRLVERVGILNGSVILSTRVTPRPRRPFRKSRNEQENFWFQIGWQSGGKKRSRLSESIKLHSAQNLLSDPSDFEGPPAPAPTWYNENFRGPRSSAL